MERTFVGTCLCLIGVSILTAGAAFPLRAQEIERPPLAVSIAAPESEGQRVLRLGDHEPRFFVVIRNVSDQPVNIYGENSSFGAYNLTFEITVVGDKTLDKPLVVTRKWGNISWFSNFPYADTLQPGDEVVREVRVQGEFTSSTDMNNDFTYRPFPLPESGGTQSVRMRAVFNEKLAPWPWPKIDSSRFRPVVWTGQIVSSVQNYEVSRSNP